MIREDQAAFLIQEARRMRTMSYCPYSSFAVGAALLGENGKVYTGCNMEVSSFGATVCAERVALGKAIADGERKFLGIAVIGGPKDEEFPEKMCSPCGICRQSLREFFTEDVPVYMVYGRDKCEVKTMGDLLPDGFLL